MTTNVPCIAGTSSNSEWSVSLVDNPGFGEANEYINQLEYLSFVASSAYLYLVESTRIDGKSAQSFFQELWKRDKGEMNYNM